MLFHTSEMIRRRVLRYQAVVLAKIAGHKKPWVEDANKRVEDANKKPWVPTKNMNGYYRYRTNNRSAS